MSDTTFMKMNADRYIRMALEEDITSEDVSTNAVMPEYKKGTVQLLCKQDGVICGLGVFLRTFELLDENTRAKFYVKDGDEVKKGQTLITFDMDAIKTAGYDVTTPLIVTNTDDYEEVKMLAEGTVNNGSEVLEVK